jgi:hypothetical protein
MSQLFEGLTPRKGKTARKISQFPLSARVEPSQARLVLILELKFPSDRGWKTGTQSPGQSEVVLGVLVRRLQCIGLRLETLLLLHACMPAKP